MKPLGGSGRGGGPASGLDTSESGFNARLASRFRLLPGPPRDLETKPRGRPGGGGEEGGVRRGAGGGGGEAR